MPTTDPTNVISNSHFIIVKSLQLWGKYKRRSMKIRTFIHDNIPVSRGVQFVISEEGLFFLQCIEQQKKAP